MIYEDLMDSTREYWMTITQCAWCHSLKVGPWHVRVPGVSKITYQQSFRLPLGPALRVTTTHGICPMCADQIVGPSFRK